MDGATGSSELSPSDRLSLSIGRVVQADVWLELQLRFLYQTLCGPSLAGRVVPTSFEWTRQACLVMIDMAALSGAWEEAARDVLAEVGDVHETRNRLVHDMRMFDPTASDRPPTHEQLTAHQRRLNPLRSTVSRQTLSELEALPTRVVRVQIRCSTLSLALSRLLAYADPERRDLGNHQDDLLVVQDHFDLLDDGGYRPRRTIATTDT